MNSYIQILSRAITPVVLVAGCVVASAAMAMHHEEETARSPSPGAAHTSTIRDTADTSSFTPRGDVAAGPSEEAGTSAVMRPSAYVKVCHELFCQIDQISNWPRPSQDTFFREAWQAVTRDRAIARAAKALNNATPQEIGDAFDRCLEQKIILDKSRLGWFSGDVRAKLEEENLQRSAKRFQDSEVLMNRILKVQALCRPTMARLLSEFNTLSDTDLSQEAVKKLQSGLKSGIVRQELIILLQSKAPTAFQSATICFEYFKELWSWLDDAAKNSPENQRLYQRMKDFYAQKKADFERAKRSPKTKERIETFLLQLDNIKQRDDYAVFREIGILRVAVELRNMTREEIERIFSACEVSQERSNPKSAPGDTPKERFKGVFQEIMQLQEMGHGEAQKFFADLAAIPSEELEPILREMAKAYCGEKPETELKKWQTWFSERTKPRHSLTDEENEVAIYANHFYFLWHFLGTDIQELPENKRIYQAVEVLSKMPSPLKKFASQKPSSTAGLQL